MAGTDGLPGAGYSGTPLTRKLGLKAGFVVHAVGAPEHYAALLDPLPPGLHFVTALKPDVDLVHVFTAARRPLEKLLADAWKTLRPDAVLWVSWPKKASRLPSEITEDTIRELALPMGWVDVKVCAVDDIWSGLKLVRRKELRE